MTRAPITLYPGRQDGYLRRNHAGEPVSALIVRVAIDIDRAAAALGFHVAMPEGYEEKLIERLKRRDEAAFNELVTLYQARVFHLVFRMLGDRAEAEDLAQEVFITVFKSIDGFRGDSKLSTWLYRVASNHCKNRIKYLDRRARNRKKELDEVSEHGMLESASMSSSAHIARPDHLVEAYEKERILKEAIASLEDDHRELIVLRDIESLSYEEIQDITGLPTGTVKSRLHRARHALKTAVEARLSDPERPGPEGGR